MLITTALLIMVYSIAGKPIKDLVLGIKNINWKEKAESSRNAIKKFGLIAGCATCKPLLTFYYVMADNNTTTADKALVYGAIIYIISPFDLFPRRVLGMLGVIDDVAFTTLVIKKVQDKITPEINAAVDATLAEWFGTAAVIN